MIVRFAVLAHRSSILAEQIRLCCPIVDVTDVQAIILKWTAAVIANSYLQSLRCCSWRNRWRCKVIICVCVPWSEYEPCFHCNLQVSHTTRVLNDEQHLASVSLQSIQWGEVSLIQIFLMSLLHTIVRNDFKTTSLKLCKHSVLHCDTGTSKHIALFKWSSCQKVSLDSALSDEMQWYLLGLESSNDACALNLVAWGTSSRTAIPGESACYKFGCASTAS